MAAQGRMTMQEAVAVARAYVASRPRDFPLTDADLRLAGQLAQAIRRWPRPVMNVILGVRQ